VFSEVVIFYRERNFCYLAYTRESEDEDSRRHWLFRVFREMHKVRNFRLVLCADVWYCAGMYPMRVLKHDVAVEGRGEGFGSSFPEPLVTYSQRRSGSDGLGRTYHELAGWYLL